MRAVRGTIPGVSRRPPGPRAPAIVQALRYSRNALGFFVKMHERYGDVFRLSFPSFRNVVYVAEPGLVKELFTGDPAELHAGKANATILEPAVGPSSVLTLDGASTCASASCCSRRSTGGRSTATAR